AFVRTRTVADEVAQAPERVGPLAGDLVERGLEGVQVTVDVGNDRDAHRLEAVLAWERNPTGARRDLDRRGVLPLEPDESARRAEPAEGRPAHGLPLTAPAPDRRLRALRAVGVGV